MQARSLLAILVAIAVLAVGYLVVDSIVLPEAATDTSGGLDTKRPDTPDALTADAAKDPTTGSARTARRDQPTARADTQTTGERGSASVSARFVSTTGAPVVAATAELHRKSVVPGNPGRSSPSIETDSTGAIRFESLAPGQYSIALSGKSVPVGFASKGFALADGQSLDLGEIQVPPGITVSGRLVSDVGPVGDALVRLGRGSFSDFLGPATESTTSATTDASGRFAFQPVIVRDYTLLADHPDFVRLERRIEATRATGPAMDLGDLRLYSGRAITGRVVDTAGKGIASVEITPKLVSVSGTSTAKGYSTARAVTSDREGNFKLAGLPPAVELRVRADGYQMLIDHGIPDDRDYVVLRLEPECAISGRVTGRPSTGKTRVALELLRSTGQQEMARMLYSGNRSTECEPDGRFRFQKLKPGTYRLRADHDGYGFSQARELTIGKQGATGIELALEAGPSLVVEVRDASGPVAGATVTVSPGAAEGVPPSSGQGIRIERTGGARRRVKTGANGVANFTGMFVGAGSLQVTHETHLAESRSIDLVRGPNRQTVTMQIGGWVEGVCYNDKGQPFAGATVLIRPANEARTGMRRRYRREGRDGHDDVVIGGVRRANADSNGRFKSEPLRPGAWSVALAAGRQPMSFGGTEMVLLGDDDTDKGSMVEAQVAAGTPSQVVLRQSIMGTLIGVVSSRGRQIAGARVFAWPKDSDGFNAKRAVTERDGGYRIEGLTPGKWTVTAKPPRGAISSNNVEVEVPATGGEKTCDVVLGGGVVEGFIERSSSSPVYSSLQIMLRARSTGGAPQQRRVAIMVTADASGNSAPNMSTSTLRPPTAPEPVTVNNDGRFRIEFVPAGEWELVVEDKSGTRYFTKTLSLKKDESKDVGTLALKPIFPVNLEIVDTNGNPVPMGLLSVMKKSGDGKERVNVFRGLARGGKVKIPGLSPGTYDLRFQKIDAGASGGGVSSPETQEGKLIVGENGSITGTRLSLTK